MRKLLLFIGALLALSAGASAQCVSKFSGAQSPSGNNLLNANFIDSSYYGLPYSGQLRQFIIYFGDGNTATGISTGSGFQLPSHVYATPGTRTAKLVVKNVDSASSAMYCTDTSTISITVAYPPCGSTISASGTGATRTFSASTPAGSTGMSYSWNYGDGGTGTGTPVSHTYTTSGTYTVTLTATNTSLGCSYTNTVSVTVYIAPPALNCANLKASFNTSIATNIVTTTNTSNTVSAPPYVMVAAWDYGDGGTASGFAPPPHTYSAPGVYTIKLRMQWRDSFFTTFCQDSVSSSVTILSVPTPANVISGYVVYDTVTYPISYFKVWLIKFDSATNLLSAIDSQVTASSRLPYYAFGSKPAGSYRTKAAVYGVAFTGTGLVPTYHDSSVYWGTASVINHTGGSTINQRIYMRSGTLGTGPGFIGGNVSYGANKGTAGNGVPNLLVFLRNSVMKVVKMAVTDSNGDYSFSNLPLGAYSVWPELINYSTIPVTPIALNNSGFNSPSNNFKEDVLKRSIQPGSLSEPTVYYGTAGLYVYPVPAHSEVMVTWIGANASTGGGLVITTATGQVVKTIRVEDVSYGRMTIDIRNLASGLYFLHGTGSLSGKPTKLIVQ